MNTLKGMLLLAMLTLSAGGALAQNAEPLPGRQQVAAANGKDVRPPERTDDSGTITVYRRAHVPDEYANPTGQVEHGRDGTISLWHPYDTYSVYNR